MVFAEGAKVIYTKTGEQATVLTVHVDDPDGAYYEIQFASGAVKQTTPEYLAVGKRSRVCDDEAQSSGKAQRPSGAVVAPSRTAEGYQLAIGNGETCLVDAVINGARQLGVDSVSHRRLCSLAVPVLGNVRQASWASVKAGLAELQAPLSLVEASKRFYGAGPPMLALLKAAPGVYIVRMMVVVDDRQSWHCVMLSTISDPHAPHGKLIDNRCKPVYLEPDDKASKKGARLAFQMLLEQNSAFAAARSRRFDIADVYEIKIVLM
jgi:hypothetical protein